MSLQVWLQKSVEYFFDFGGLWMKPYKAPCKKRREVTYYFVIVIVFLTFFFPPSSGSSFKASPALTKQVGT